MIAVRLLKGYKQRSSLGEARNEEKKDPASSVCSLHGLTPAGRGEEWCKRGF
jgi:hypothetical protein